MIHYRPKHDALSSHQQIVRIIQQLNRGPVLDVGSAQGMLGQALAGSGLVVDAIEPDARWLEVARPFYRTVCHSTIEAASLNAGVYRVIVCADVLEHLVDPAGVLKRLRDAATDDATFIISLPNVAHISIRLMLFLGLFPKMERGILDRTHLQFFTRRTAIDMLARAGLGVRQISQTPVPIELITTSPSVNRIGGLVQRVMIRLRPSLFAYQWIFVATGTHG